MVRHEAIATIEERRAQITYGMAESVPLPVDAVSTAKKVIAARDEFGEGSPQHMEVKAGLDLDCGRLLSEWYRRNKPEIFEVAYHQFEAETEDFYSHGLSIGQMTFDGLTPQDNPEDEARRINEHVEERTPQILRRALGRTALHGKRIRTISQCTKTAILAYEQDFAAGRPHQGYNGYVPEIEKGMIRDIWFDEHSDGRFQEQIGLPGTYFQPFIYQRALERRNLDVHSKDRTELHGTQFLAEDDLIDFTRDLDDIAGEHYGLTFFMGEVVPADHPKDYGTIREEARQRRENLQSQRLMLTDFVLTLAENNTDPREAPAIVEKFVKKMLLNMARHDTTLTADMFDQKTADGLREVAALEARGLTEDAMRRYQEVEKAAPGGGFCGAGSCGLEDLKNSDLDAVNKLGFNAKDTIKDTERRCKCGAKTVYYDLKQAKKGCTTCHKTVKY
jgi:hypothetical protein